MSTGPASAPPANPHVPALDTFRALAAIFMVVNHLGVTVTHPTPYWTIADTMTFIGSFAPVLFFFAVGFGTGLSSTPAPFASTTRKALLLVVADQITFWQAGAAGGVDFLTFIALSIIVVSAVRRTAKPVLVATLLCAALVVLRFGLGVAAPGLFNRAAFLTWLSGGGVADVSYPATPWLVYPLLGLAVARGWRRVGGRPSPATWAACLAIMLAAFGLAATMWLRDMPVFRWGTVSAAYFVLSIGVLMAAALIAVLTAEYLPAVADILSLNGVASLAVVPIHFALIRFGLMQDHGVSQTTFVTLCVVAVAMSLILSRCYEIAIRTWVPRQLSGPGLALLLVAAALAIGLSVSVGQREPALALACVSLAQLVLVVLFALRPGRALSIGQRSDAVAQPGALAGIVQPGGRRPDGRPA